MRVVVQRVSFAEVRVNSETCGHIGQGLLLLIGLHPDDTPADAQWLAHKISHMRIFHDENLKMNLSVIDVKGDILAVSQFTLYANTAKGNRPSFTNAAKPEKALPLYDMFCDYLKEITQKPIMKGIFGADMKVSLLNDGPVTILLDSHNKE